MRTVVGSISSVGFLEQLSGLGSLLELCWTARLSTGYLTGSASPWIFPFRLGALATFPWKLSGSRGDNEGESWRTHVCKVTRMEENVDEQPTWYETITSTYFSKLSNIQTSQSCVP